MTNYVFRFSDQVLYIGLHIKWAVQLKDDCLKIQVYLLVYICKCSKANAVVSCMITV